MARLPIRLRGLLAFAAVAGVMAAFAASAGAAPLLWSLNAAKDTVSTFETPGNQEVGKPIAAGDGPNSIAITPNGRRALVLDTVSETVTIIDVATRTPVATIPVASHPERVAISPDGKTAYVTVEGNENVFLVNPESNASSTTGSYKVGPQAFAVAFTPDGKYAYVGIEPGSVQVIETGTGNLVGGPIPVGGPPEAITFAPDGKTAYVSEGSEVAVIDAALRMTTQHIPVGAVASGLAVTPNGQRLYAAASGAGTVTAIETATNKTVGSPINVGTEPREVAITPDAKTAYVGVRGLDQIRPIIIATNTPGTPLTFTGAEVGNLVVAPDQSPTAIFSPPAVTTGVPANFNGTASTDPDGSVAAWSWSFGDGATASGPVVNHTYGTSGTYDASLSVTDDEGCGEAEVFTGRTAYCSGNPLAKVVQPVEAKVPGPFPVCTSRLRFGAVVHNRRNGTVRVQVRLPAAGALFLFGRKIHAVARKSVKAGSTFLTLHARVRVNKRLKRIHHTRVSYRLTFYPVAGCSPTTRHRSVALLRAPHKKKHHHHR
ncbi:MAG: PKD domain-containing protein [Actinobacteria bacterium]|nr:PKD domain-containing protein [Actinomycetota bacterium]